MPVTTESGGTITPALGEIVMGFFAGQTTEAEDDLEAERAQARANLMNPEYVKEFHLGGSGFTTLPDGTYKAADGTIYDAPYKAALASRTPEEIEQQRLRDIEQETYRQTQNAESSTWIDRFTTKLVENIPLIFNVISLGTAAYGAYAANAANAAVQLSAEEAAKAVAEGYMQNSAGTWVADLSSPVWAKAGETAVTSGIQQVAVAGATGGLSSAVIGGAVVGGIAQGALTGTGDVQSVDVKGDKTKTSETGSTNVDVPVIPPIQTVTVEGKTPTNTGKDDMQYKENKFVGALPMPIQQVTVTPGDKITKSDMTHRESRFVGPILPPITPVDPFIRDSLTPDANTGTTTPEKPWWEDLSKLLPGLVGAGAGLGVGTPEIKTSPLINMPEAIRGSAALLQQANGKATVQFGRTKSRYELRGKFKKTGIKL